MRFTVFGHMGFIGQHLTTYLTSKGHDVFTPPKVISQIGGTKLGHVIYAIGLTGDFRERTKDTIDAHVNLLNELLEYTDFESCLYLSSTRIYSGIKDLATEDSCLNINPCADSIYDLSKLLGESLCLAKSSASIRIARLSNVYGTGQSKHNFLGSLINDIQKNGKVVINEAPDSAKDYVSLKDVLQLTEAIALKGSCRIYNIASGNPVTHYDLAERIKNLTGCTIEFNKNANKRYFPKIDISKIKEQFDFSPASVIDDLPILL